MRTLVLISAFSFLGCALLAQENAQLELSRVESAQKEDGKPVLLLIRTDWCKYCQFMELHLTEDSTLMALLDEKAHFLSFDAECEDSVRFMGRWFGRGGKYHALAEALVDKHEEVVLPSIAVLDKDGAVVFEHSGYLDREQLLAVLREL